MSLTQRRMKFKPRIKWNDNMHIHQKWWSSPKFFDDLCLATWSTWLLFSWFPLFISTTTPLHNTVNSLLQSKSHFVNEFISLWTESLSGHTAVDTTATPALSVVVNCILVLCVALWDIPIHIQDFCTYSIQ